MKSLFLSYSIVLFIFLNTNLLAYIPWLDNDDWKGKAEIARYSGFVWRYHQKRKASLDIITVTEAFDPIKKVKSGSSKRAIPVLKQIQILKFPTGVYSYQFMNSLFWSLKNNSLIKSNMSSQEWCGQSFKDVRLFPNDLVLRFNTYWEKEGIGEYHVKRPKENISILYDELPLWLRAQEVMPKKNIYLFPLLMSSQVNKPYFEIGQSAKKPQYYPVKIKTKLSKIRIGKKLFRDVNKISIHAKNNNVDHFYIHQKGKNKVLLAWLRHDKSAFYLKALYYTPYWKKNKINDSLTRNRIASLKE